MQTRQTHSTALFVYLVLLALGLIVPFSQFVPWLLENGLNLPLFFGELFGSRISAFFGWDVIMAVFVLIATLVMNVSKFSTNQRILVAVGTLFGASVGLPLYLLIMEWNKGKGQTTES